VAVGSLKNYLPTNRHTPRRNGNTTAKIDSSATNHGIEISINHFSCVLLSSNFLLYDNNMRKIRLSSRKILFHIKGQQVGWPFIPTEKKLINRHHDI
jgi:hypothetical protein